MAFNGDITVQKEAEKIIKNFKIKVAIETGTHIGGTTKFLAEHVEKVETIEINTHMFNEACKNLFEFKNVTIHLGNSISKLEELLPKISLENELVLLYLDAHWYDPWPLLNELEKIKKYMYDRAIIIIDDFEVPNRNYKYDVYKSQKNNYEYIREKLNEVYNKYEYYYSNNKENSTKSVGKIYIFPENIFAKYGKKKENFFRTENGVNYSLITE